MCVYVQQHQHTYLPATPHCNACKLATAVPGGGGEGGCQCARALPPVTTCDPAAAAHLWPHLLTAAALARWQGARTGCLWSGLKQGCLAALLPRGSSSRCSRCSDATTGDGADSPSQCLAQEHAGPHQCLACVCIPVTSAATQCLFPQQC